ncbi:outer membrane protein transport protein, partial [Salipiger sp. HF18]|uniref:outer membrane protein transport protein n=1 Tax=Salipiger sp. HF18 TaxID=2721557 RepID=UPI0020CAEBB9
MRSFMYGAATLALSAAAAQAGGVERTTQSALILFEPGNVFELSLAYVDPSLSGENISPPFPAQDIGDVGEDFWLPSFALKYDLNDRIALAFIYDRPYGADVAYESGNFPFGGTTAEAQTHALTALVKYKFNDNFSVFGGLRQQKAEGSIHLEGL